MKNWNQLFLRHGWLMNQIGNCSFDCRSETGVNVDFLLDSLEKLHISYTFESGLLKLLDQPVTEEEWLKAVDYEGRGRGEGVWFQSGKEQPIVQELDTYISGVVRQLNRLGFHTTGSCDGHGRRVPHVLLTKDNDIEVVTELFLALGIKQVNCRKRRNHYHVSLHITCAELLDLAEKLGKVDQSWLSHGIEYMKEKRFLFLIEEMLSIPGKSGNEERVRRVVLDKLTPFVDHVTVDHAGNVLAEKTYGTGNGPTILLNAHLDIAHELEDERSVMKEGNRWYSSKGILGADDRAGVAILLHVAEYLHNNSSFRGRVKFIFTVEEECGLVGARKVNDYFLWGTDAAIVVDRRGTGDIVTTCGGSIPFCHDAYGALFEEIAVLEGIPGWKVTTGGSSDTRIWAEHGIQSVNLSVGYSNEHTDSEFLNVEAAYGTVKLLDGILKNERKLKQVLREIRRERRLVHRRAI
ncbi:M42 glutamyl aminopeptidase [Oceanobacillus limi]|uniref:M42 glutamyl aminopeptidase n=1 Tax=Oceanobacillus limi TaxID=930131 RepID=A0A1I0FEP9_9BACI|nr:M20/M25/M40 family metallo-hydrolase [Oceanobacillus limi]SET56636.1 M42 glutamyl aminopeptidase [Oceanobacillus limi]